MQVAKNEMQGILDNIPEQSELEELQYHLYVLEKIKRGQQAVDEGRVISHDEVKARLTIHVA